ncbi:elongation factor Ts [Fistulifera solaris]|uniref:Elongation factor Ts n=1 Tax=Fistulifera solaris TaxID=1519565 RepID=A0A1Z5KR57_FISSO|nr:elongation factor Ts [Fistulifera solaris]|eukprot:GAX28803.1 elongation factor Ts [Fistulifera solaris]
MHFSTTAVSAFLFSVGSVSAFSPAPVSGFVASRVSSGVSPPVADVVASHASGCVCAACSRRKTMILFADVAEVPGEVAAMDGIESEDEAHNAERPARKSLKKKGPQGKPLGEYKVGDTVKGRVKTIASYGAFIDIGAQTDGLLHISQLSVGFVKDVKEILELNSEIDVRITNIDEKKNQVALSLLSAEQAEEAKAQAPAPRQQKERQQRQQRSDDSAVVNGLKEKGWDQNKFVEGTVISTVDFGAFVRINAADLNPEVEGELDGLVHISALSVGRVSSVDSAVKVNEKVQVRVKEIANRKVSLTMVSVEDEETISEAKAVKDVGPGNANWKEDSAKIQMPAFKNGPVVVDLRK